MPRTREELEQIERQILAPFAQFSGDTRGREHPERPPAWRTHYQRDRDRIIHSRAFRRLEYKTQVFLNGTGDHLRSRLTHTIEVAAVSRNIASALRLNSDLAEAIALAHDLGQKLGCGAHLCALRRTATDKFRIEAALPLEELEKLPVVEIEKRLLPVYEVVPSFVA